MSGGVAGAAGAAGDAARGAEPGSGRLRSELVGLAALAEHHGVLRSYTGVDCAEHYASPDAVMAVLRSMGVAVDRPEDAGEVLRAEQAAAGGRWLPPVLVHWTARPRPFRVTLPSNVHPRDGWLTVTMDGGQVRRERLLTAIARPLSGSMVDGRRVDSYQLRLGASPFELPVGYHELRMEAPGIDVSTLLIAAPRCPQADRGWGAFLPLHAVRAADDLGVGTYRHLGQLLEWVRELGGGYVGTLPLYPAFLDHPVETSPYLPVTRLGWNELHIDPTTLPELAAAPEAAALLASDEVVRRITDARNSVLVDHVGVMATVRSLLEPMAEALFASDGDRRDRLQAFVDRRPEVAAYARFRAAGSRAGGAGVDRRAHRDGRIGDEAVDAAAERYHLYAQWVADEQLAAAAGGDGLYLDLPIGVHPLGFDPWWEPEAFVTGAHGGAPPDAFYRGGQDWGFPPLHPEGVRAGGYRYLRTCLEHVLRRAGTLRVDHVMGLHRLFWVPEGSAPTDGVYVRYPDEELRAVVAVEAHRARAAVVGEDLGTVPEEVRAGMAADAMLRLWVLQFETSAEDPLPDAPPASMASWGTHDLPRFAAFWDGADIDEREGRGDLDVRAAPGERIARARWRRSIAERLGTGHDPAAVLTGCLEHLAAGPARQVLVELEDLWLERRPQNRPGTGPEVPNWRRRAARSLEQLRDDPVLAGLLSGLTARRRPPPASTPPGAPGTPPGAPGTPPGAPGGPAKGAGTRPLGGSGSGWSTISIRREP
ncbi:MAG: 4-alpha-glucanotransferase [Acidimicrobiales bacterium]